MNYKILQEIIVNLENFEVQQPSKVVSMEDFVGFLNQKYLGQKISDETNEVNNQNVAVMISQLVGFMYRYAKSYIKKTLEESTILTLEDFGYLAVIEENGSLTKTQAIEKNIHEKNTGMEIIKRLINNQLLEQHDDENDKRSKRLKITPLGRAELFKSLDGMLKVSKIISGKLSDTERLQLFYLLNKLHNFHNPIFLNEKETSVDNLLQKYF